MPDLLPVGGDARSQRTAKGTPLGRLYAADAVEELGATSFGLAPLGPDTPSKVPPDARCDQVLNQR